MDMIPPRDIFGGLGNRMFQMAYLYARVRDGAIPDLYLQDPSYFANCKEEIRKLYSGNIDSIDMVSLHIRRGDYVNNPFYVSLTDTDYYEEAVAQFPKGTKFLVFCADRQKGSDDKYDIEWCKAYLCAPEFDGYEFEFWQGEDEIADFNAMAGCKAHILANSSFSWWAAFVGEGKTVAPSKWYGDGRPGIPLLAEWTVI